MRHYTGARRRYQAQGALPSVFALLPMDIRQACYYNGASSQANHQGKPPCKQSTVALPSMTSSTAIHYAIHHAIHHAEERNPDHVL
jgi:hypothetical protein